MRTFEMIAQTSRETANNRTCFWNTRCVFCRAIATMMRIDRNSALAALRYETMLSPARAGSPVSMLHRQASGRLFKRSQAVIRPDSTRPVFSTLRIVVENQQGVVHITCREQLF